MTDNETKRQVWLTIHFNKHTSISTSIDTSVNQSQPDRGGPLGFRTIGRLSDRGGLRLQDNRQTGEAIHFTQLSTLINDLELTTSSLTVAGPTASGQPADWLITPLHPTSFYRPTSTNHFNKPPRSTTSNISGSRPPMPRPD
ncbi:hypothetical protein N7530_007226 [Penicillium desertorum]|uniref:Uncharacterized protein n=1 Tax=Penicillium desertorum TaxID=1303715 RepID=A0A9X0BJV1_9EURO|nr:hypothetical protein N7530_007226 [Penicillium desertorum]